MSLFRTKPLKPNLHEHTRLQRCLTAFDVTLLGIGTIIGLVIYFAYSRKQSALH